MYNIQLHTHLSCPKNYTNLSESSVAKEATDNKVNKNTEELARVKIGKVLKTGKGKSLGNNQTLKKQDPVETGTSYKTLAGGTLHLVLDENSKIIIGNESEIIIKSFAYRIIKIYFIACVIFFIKNYFKTRYIIIF